MMPIISQTVKDRSDFEETLNLLSTIHHGCNASEAMFNFLNSGCKLEFSLKSKNVNYLIAISSLSTCSLYLGILNFNIFN